jgi:hypothetical protein
MPGGVTQRYLGSAYTLVASVIYDWYVVRFLWNYWNPVVRIMYLWPGYNNNNAVTSFATVVGGFKEIVAGASTLLWMNGLEQMVGWDAHIYLHASAAGSIFAAIIRDGAGIAYHLGYAANPAGATVGTFDNAGASGYIDFPAGAHTLSLQDNTVTNAQTIYTDFGRAGGLAQDNVTTWIGANLVN